MCDHPIWINLILTLLFCPVHTLSKTVYEHISAELQQLENKYRNFHIKLHVCLLVSKYFGWKSCLYLFNLNVLVYKLILVIDVFFWLFENDYSLNTAI